MHAVFPQNIGNMHKVRLQFWNIATHIFFLFCIILLGVVVLDLVGRTPHKIDNYLKSIPFPASLKALPSQCVHIWLPCAIGATISFLLALVSARRKRSQRAPDSLFKVLPSPTGGCLRAADLAQFKKECRGAPREARRGAAQAFRLAERHFSKHRHRDAANAYQRSADALPTMASHLNLGASL